MLPTFKGLVELKHIFLDYNNFTAIPADFFDGLDSLVVIALDHNPNLNVTNGWLFPLNFQNSAQLANISMVSCNLVGLLPDYLGNFSSLGVLKLSTNRFHSGIPKEFEWV
ncbi:hypothetical protein RND81_08G204100 [Saponaria officinalis]|uniref:Uncharacterized protein n=1 Tax=Saponaria officinalis TaxID=3572 RepID=A0AAW1JBC8_SAPOF